MFDKGSELKTFPLVPREQQMGTATPLESSEESDSEEEVNDEIAVVATPAAEVATPHESD